MSLFWLTVENIGRRLLEVAARHQEEEGTLTIVEETRAAWSYAAPEPVRRSEEGSPAFIGPGRLA